MSTEKLQELDTPDATLDDVVQPFDDTQFEIRLVTKLPTKYRIPHDKIVVPGNLSRVDLSELINESLSLGDRVPFDFLINHEFLRGSLSVHFLERGILSEKTVEIEYVLAMEEPTSSDFPEPQNDWITGICVQDGHVFTSSADGFISKFQTETGTKIAASSQSELPLCDIIGTDNGILVTVGKDGVIRFADANSLELVGIGKLDHGFQSAAVCPFDQTLVLTGSTTGAVHLWNVPVLKPKANSKKRSVVETLEPRATLLQKTSGIVSIVWLSISRAIAACQDGTIHVFDPVSDISFPTISINRSISTMALLGSSKIVTGHPDGRVIFWEIKRDGSSVSLEAVNSCRSHSRYISKIASRLECDFLVATASIDGCVKLFDSRASHFAVQSISLPPAERALAVVWIDERRFISGGSDGVVRVHTLKLE